jgi:hypothetical protein
MDGDPDKVIDKYLEICGWLVWYLKNYFNIENY